MKKEAKSVKPVKKAKGGHEKPEKAQLSIGDEYAAYRDLLQKVDEVYGIPLDLLRISVDNIEEEMAKQPALYAYHAARVGIMEGRVSRAKAHLSEVLATVELEVREQFSSGEIQLKLTEGTVTACVKSHPAVLQAQEHYHDIYEQHAALSAFVNALDQRRWMLVSIAGLRKAETV